MLDNAEKKRRNTEWELPAESAAFWGLAILLLLPPYFRGVLFPAEEQWGLTLAGIVFLLAWLRQYAKHDRRFLARPLDYFVLALPIAYLLSAAQAADYHLALDEAVKTTLYFLVYWVSSRLVKGEKRITVILQVIYLSAVGTALGVLIYSSSQYPGPLAGYLSALIFAGGYLWLKAERSPGAGIISRCLYAVGNFLLFAVLFGTGSGEGMVAFFVVLVVFLAGLPKMTRLPVFIHYVLTGASGAGVAVLGVLPALAKSNAGLAWLWVLCGLVLAAGGQVLYEFIREKALLDRFTGRPLAALAGLALTVIAAGVCAGIYLGGHGEAIKAIAEQLSLGNVTERVYFYRDAVLMFKERPIFGWGGGWQEVYQAYYDPGHVRGYFFLLMVETGLLGLMAAAGIWGLFFLKAHRLYHGSGDNQDRPMLVLTITIMVVAVSMSAAIDLELPYASLPVGLWALFGIIGSMEQVADHRPAG